MIRFQGRQILAGWAALAIALAVSGCNKIEYKTGASQIEGLQPTYGSLSASIFVPMCVQCHGPGGADGIDLSTYAGVKAAIDSADPEKTKLMYGITQKGMPLGKAPLSDQEKSVIVAWIQAGAPDNGPTPPPPPPPPALAPNFESLNANIFKPKCAGCHAKATDDNQDVELADYAGVKAQVDDPNPENTTLWFGITQGGMPKNGKPLSQAEQDALKAWMQAGAPNNSAPKPGTVTPTPVTPVTPVTTNPVPTKPTPTEPPVTATLVPTFASLDANIFVPKCKRCHSKATDGNSDVELSDFAGVKTTVDAPKAEDTTLWAAITQEGMPLKDKPLTAQELAALKTWIDKGALQN